MLRRIFESSTSRRQVGLACCSLCRRRRNEFEFRSCCSRNKVCHLRSLQVLGIHSFLQDDMPLFCRTFTFNLFVSLWEIIVNTHRTCSFLIAVFCVCCIMLATNECLQLQNSFAWLITMWRHAGHQTSTLRKLIKRSVTARPVDKVS